MCLLEKEQQPLKAHHFEEKDMRTVLKMFRNRLKILNTEQLTPYAGHDTVGMVGLDASGDMVAGTSTSGLFMKKPGRVGDSPLSDLDYMSTARLVVARRQRV